jgi:hypothetical protein
MTEENAKRSSTIVVFEGRRCRTVRISKTHTLRKPDTRSAHISTAEKRPKLRITHPTRSSPVSSSMQRISKLAGGWSNPKFQNQQRIHSQDRLL